MGLMNFIGNEFAKPMSGEWFPHFSPWTGEADCEVPNSGVMDVVRALQAANKGWALWQKVDLPARLNALRSIADEIDRRATGLAKIQSEDEGSPEPFVRSASLPRAAHLFRFYADLAAELAAAPAAPQNLDGISCFARKLPHGVVSIITPYCDPLVLLASRVAPALAAGNVVIAKPSEFSPRTANAFAEILLAAGLPAGVFGLVQGRGTSAGQVISSHPGLNHVSLIGSTETGRHVLRESADMLKKTHFALGARNPVLVFAGLDLDRHMGDIATATLQFHGPTCLRGSRIFVQESIYKDFLERYRKAAESVISRLGPLNNIDLQNRFTAAVRQAVKENGKILFGGESCGPGFFVQPTAIQDLTLCSTLQQEEVVGPFVTISSFKYQHDAIKQANTSPYGRAAYVFESDPAKALRIAGKLEAGQIFLNQGGPVPIDRIASEGLKGSGVGREGAEELLAFYSKSTVTVAVPLGPSATPFAP